MQKACITCRIDAAELLNIIRVHFCSHSWVFTPTTLAEYADNPSCRSLISRDASRRCWIGTYQSAPPHPCSTIKWQNVMDKSISHYPRHSLHVCKPPSDIQYDASMVGSDETETTQTLITRIMLFHLHSLSENTTQQLLPPCG